MDGVKFEFNDIISLYKKNDSERKALPSTFTVKTDTKKNLKIKTHIIVKSIHLSLRSESKNPKNQTNKNYS